MYKQKDIEREILMPPETKIFLGISSDTTLRKYEKMGLKVNRFKGSNRKYYFKKDLEKYLNM